MKRKVIILIVVNFYNFVLTQTLNNSEDELTLMWRIESEVKSSWLYFRRDANPLLNKDSIWDKWMRDYKSPWEIFQIQQYISGYDMSIKIKPCLEELPANWTFMDKNLCRENFFIVEKSNGYPLVKIDFETGEILDSVNINLYDSIFPYDNRFLVARKKNGYFTCISGNAQWGSWDDTGLVCHIETAGYVRGVQFGVQCIKPYRKKISEAINKYRPEYPDYVYAEAYKSLLADCILLIAAPIWKEDSLIEFIFYSNYPEKTGDNNPNNIYEFRYILPTYIKSIKERRLEKRRLTDEERKHLFDDDNPLLRYVEMKEHAIEEISIEFEE
ncbi:hypothetical protein FACS189429_7450 [Bacteroidia bacterium]|nr:hypothetical protein FACS189429_7450 [Bacteroidia bacterium]